MENKNLLAIIICFMIYLPAIIKLVSLLINEGKKGFLKLKRLLVYMLCSTVAVLVLLIVLNHINFLNYKSPIPYKQIDNITFDDFRGFEFFRSNLYGERKFAYVVTDVESKLTDDYILSIAYFHPSKSYVFNKKTYSKSLLKHELYHFKITEMFNRYIKKRVLDLPTENREEMYDVILKQEFNKEHNYQRMYDEITFHGYILKNQRKVEKEVDSVLNLLELYKADKIYFNHE